MERCERDSRFFLKAGERLDDTGFGGLLLIQEPSSFCYGVDAVLLADFAARTVNGQGGRTVNQPGRKIVKTVTEAIRICDLGTGSGIVPLILSHKTRAARLVGVEVQEASWERACRSVEGNGLTDRIHLLHGDVSELEGLGEELSPTSFDLVTTNPPYMPEGTALRNEMDAKWIARHETSAALEDFIEAAAYLLKPKGSFCMVHRPSRLVDIFCLCRSQRLEPKELRMISPHPGEKPNLVLVRCIKGGGPELRVCNPLAVHERDGSYAREILEIYEKTPDGVSSDR